MVRNRIDRGARSGSKGRDVPFRKRRTDPEDERIGSPEDGASLPFQGREDLAKPKMGRRTSPPLRSLPDPLVPSTGGHRTRSRRGCGSLSYRFFDRWSKDRVVVEGGSGTSRGILSDVFVGTIFPFPRPNPGDGGVRSNRTNPPFSKEKAPPIPLLFHEA